MLCDHVIGRDKNNSPIYVAEFCGCAHRNSEKFLYITCILMHLPVK